MCYAPRQARDKDKFGERSRKCIFVGYPFGTKGWRLFDLERNEFFVSRDVTFFEASFLVLLILRMYLHRFFRLLRQWMIGLSRSLYQGGAILLHKNMHHQLCLRRYHLLLILLHLIIPVLMCLHRTLVLPLLLNHYRLLLLLLLLRHHLIHRHRVCLRFWDAANVARNRLFFSRTM